MAICWTASWVRFRPVAPASSDHSKLIAFGPEPLPSSTAVPPASMLCLWGAIDAVSPAAAAGQANSDAPAKAMKHRFTELTYNPWATMATPVPFGSYLLLDRLALGGMAEIFLAKQIRDGGFVEKPCVIKRVLPHLASDD